MSKRTFTDSLAKRASVPLFIGLVGPSGSGKTYSALRLATGIQRVAGGDIGYIDTEADRALHYADDFTFRHLPFAAPFDPLSYLAAVEHFLAKGTKTLVIDSASHMHEGPGGTLEAHSAELDRIAGNDWKKRERCKMLAWQKPKQDLRRFINSVLQLKINIIFCFRAKEKLKIQKGKEPLPLGFMPIAGDEMVYEMMLQALLYPGSKGVPTWRPPLPGEKLIAKLPGQFSDLFSKPEPLREAHGETMARWAAGDALSEASEPHGPSPEERVSPAELKELASILMSAGITTKAARNEWLAANAGKTAAQLTSGDMGALWQLARAASEVDGNESPEDQGKPAGDPTPSEEPTELLSASKVKVLRVRASELAGMDAEALDAWCVFKFNKKLDRCPADAEFDVLDEIRRVARQKSK